MNYQDEVRDALDSSSGGSLTALEIGHAISQPWCFTKLGRVNSRKIKAVISEMNDVKDVDGIFHLIMVEHDESMMIEERFGPVLVDKGEWEDDGSCSPFYTIGSGVDKKYRCKYCGRRRVGLGPDPSHHNSRCILRT